MAVEDAVEVFVHVVEHVHHLHGRAVVAEGGEAHDIAEVNGDLVEQLRLHTTRLLQRPHHGPVCVWVKQKKNQNTRVTKVPSFLES